LPKLLKITRLLISPSQMNNKMSVYQQSTLIEEAVISL